LYSNVLDENVQACEHRIATLKRTASNNVMDGQFAHKCVAAEAGVELGERVLVELETDATAVGVPDMLGAAEDDDETIGSCMTSFDDELWAFWYELPPPTT